ncbi:cytosine deaminase [Sugiyamaella lignohabitans]|uniref:Cytosine deaminase n=1 Tax=Sugiyamaella lignohabitans TaxID=796027 RepID=A0A161HFI9_9ASCO|nr:cytosine deaminase [Sugiyamaella lignohabitans]ANB11301.1 cytosine deaminase [Sugiyamaella lignohabitans]
MQKGSPILHGEMDALENAGRLKGEVYKGATMYTTLSPCHMCTGACLMYGIKRVVMGENETFIGGEDLLRSKGVEVINIKSGQCKRMMDKFIKKAPKEWFEDIGEVEDDNEGEKEADIPEDLDSEGSEAEN